MKQPDFHNASIENKHGTLLGRICDTSEFALIDSLVVKQIKQGFGGQLFNAFEAKAKALGKRGITIEVFCRNANAIGFWKHYGFEEVGQSPDGYIEMVKRFAN